MCTIEDIRVNIQPVPQQVTAGKGSSLKLTSGSRFCFTAPKPVRGPAATAVEDMKAYLVSKCGEDCFAENGIPVTLKLAKPPKVVKSVNEGYRIVVSERGITLTGYGDSGLFYAVTSFRQLCKWDSTGCTIPAVEILDWPDYPFRGLKEESRYGSNVMEKQDWFAMIDDLAGKKFNRVCISLYGCWTVQYDGRVAEYLYLPLKDYPLLKTPQTVKYYSPSQGKWVNYETLPPIYRDNFFGEVVRYAKDRGIDIIPGINSFGHNTLFPAQLPEVSPKDEEGNPTKTGFCTSSDETYKLLFSFYDQVIDDYLIPNGITTFNIMLDEVWDQYGANADMPEKKLSAWCKCEKCRQKDIADIFFDHAFKIIRHLKEKGMTSIMMANDMFVREKSQLGENIGARMMEKITEYDVADVLVMDWWRYTDLPALVHYSLQPDELGLRSIFCPWNGYYIWDCLTSPMRNIQWQAEMMHESKVSEGLYSYAMWDRSYDRIHDCHTDYCWNYQGTGSPEDVTGRYVKRHFAPLFEKVLHAYKLIDWITEQRKDIRNPEDPLATVVSNFQLVRARLGYYTYCYYKEDAPYPRHFPGEPLKILLAWRRDYERAIYSVNSMAKEAQAIFEEAAVIPGCDQQMAQRMAYECQNYVTLMEDWLAFLRIYDLTQSGDQKDIAPIAKARKEARLALMLRCEQVKEPWVQQGAMMRNQSVFMQIFADIEAYINRTEKPRLDLMDITPIMSRENWILR